MKKFKVKQINTPEYWNTKQTATDFGLRQEKYASLIPKGTKVIVELGCGLSPFLKHINIEEKWGVDFSPVTIETCNRRQDGVNYICEDVRHTSIPDKSCDVCVAGEVIEHLENPQELIDEMLRITKNRVIISTPILEFEDPEHLWEFDEYYFFNKGFKTEVVKSIRFKGREYIFAWKDL